MGRMQRPILCLVALLRAPPTAEAQFAPPHPALLQKSWELARSAQPEGGDGDEAEQMVIVHEHQHVHEHVHQHEHVHEHDHVHEHQHTVWGLAPASPPVASFPIAAAPAPPATLAPIITTTELPTLEPAMSRVVMFDEQQLGANIQRVSGSLNTVTSQLNHLRDSLVRWGPSLTTLHAGAASDLAKVIGNQATFARLRGSIGQAGVDSRLSPLLANVAVLRASSAVISTRLGEPPHPAGAVNEDVPLGSLSHRIAMFNSSMILAKPGMKAKLEELSSVEQQLDENVTAYADHVAQSATDEVLRAIPHALADQVTNAMSPLNQ